MTNSRWKKLVLLVVKVALGLLVIAAVARHVVLIALDLTQRRAWPRVDLIWMALAVITYLAGLYVYGVWFSRVLAASATGVTRLLAIRSYLISHLGKYVPGKALVVVMRVALVVPGGARASTAAFATIYETLVMMSAGGFMAALGFLLAPVQTVPLNLGALGDWPIAPAALGLVLGLCFLAATLPGVFHHLSRTVSLPFPTVDRDAIPRTYWALLAEGLALSSLGWLLLGLSQVLVLQALGWQSAAEHVAPVVASVALATVAGFAVPVAPGGLGVREWVLWTSLGSVLDHERAVVASLALRLVWVVGEILAAGVLLLWRGTARTDMGVTPESPAAPASSPSPATDKPP